MDWADSAARRLRDYQGNETVFLTRPGDEFELEYEPRHPLLNRPRLLLTLPDNATPDSVQKFMTDNNFGHLFSDWWQATGDRMFRNL